MRATATPREVAEALEDTPGRPDSQRERFRGYGVMGLPFESGHVLGLRRFPVSSIGPAYTSLWHRSPDGRWSFWSTAAPEVSCARYAGEVSDDTHQTAIRLAWREPYRLTITADDPASRAYLEAADLGRPAPLPEQATIGDFRIPQHGLLAVGALDFDPLSPAQHSTRTARG